MDSCCQDKACELEALRGTQYRVLWIVLGINAGMFTVEVILGLLAGSTALLADSLDMLGDALVYGFSIFVVARGTRWRASAALLKGLVMAGFGLMVLTQAGYHFISPEVPDFKLMGVAGALALAANATCLLLLTNHRNDDLNMRSTWICSRNDIIANLGILVAAIAVFATGSMWPDLVVGLLITVVFIRSAVHVVPAGYQRTSHPCGNRTGPVADQLRGTGPEAMQYRRLLAWLLHLCDRLNLGMLRPRTSYRRASMHDDALLRFD
ncbi:MAG: cation transporter [Chloroflexi bacterium]|nr:cation transporter [Chloroflexota bacterium]MDA1270885.1 cation transporter [Chloroflexota bacterium]